MFLRTEKLSSPGGKTLFFSPFHTWKKTFLLFLGILGKTFHLVLHGERKTSGISPGSPFYWKYSAGNLFFTQFQTLNFSFLLVFPFRLEKMLSVMIKWKKIIIIVWKCSLRKEKKRFHVWNWMQVYSPDLFFFLKFIFHKWINTKVQCLKQLEKISHRMTKTFSPTLFHSRRKKNFPLKK